MTREYWYKLRRLIRKALESLSDGEALESVDIFPEWRPDYDYVLLPDPSRVRWNDKLYKCRQTHHSLEQYPPDLVPALWEVVEKPGDGDSPDTPIAYSWGMELKLGKYYEQFGVVYICTNGSMTAVYADLANLVPLYVKVYEATA